MKMSGSKILIESLRKEGVDTIFGYPGGALIPIYDVLYGEESIRHILVRHEQGAVHAADGYARSTGKAGVCLVTSGPGATNTVTGIATAYMDSIPMIIITGQVNTNMIGNDAFQEADIVGITRPCTKYSYLVKRTEDIAQTVKEAFYIATTGKPGPVLIDIPKDVTTGTAKFSYPESVSIRSYNPTYKGHVGQVKKAVDAMAKATKPLIFIGGGIIASDAAGQLKKFTDQVNIPVVSSLMGLGGFPGDNELFLGMCGMHGTYHANMAMTHTDLLIAIGVRFDDRVTGNISKFAPNAKIIHIDIDPTSISKNVPADIPIVGDASDIIKNMNEVLKKVDCNWKGMYKKWLEEIGDWKRSNPLHYKQGKTTIKPQYVIEQIYEMTKGKSVIVATEVGQNQMGTAQFFPVLEPRTFVTSGGLGTMGYGLPAAIGAQVAFPNKLVFDIAGDGSIQMNIQELATAVQHKLPVKVIILNNGYLGMVRQWQEFFFDKRYSHTDMQAQPDFVKLAEAYGALGLRATKVSEVNDVLKKAIEATIPVVVDVRVDREENVYPMVPAGGAINEMLLA
ncbi:MAG: biosynthetic-type acetolactate synthase large subunit [Nitrospinota bacterium]